MKFPKTDIKTDLVVFPSFTDSGRYRTQIDLSVSREFITDLFLDLSFYYATDNQAPEEAGRSDWGVVTSVAYSF